jgi:hypothetical protein
MSTKSSMAGWIGFAAIVMGWKESAAEITSGG